MIPHASELVTIRHLGICDYELIWREMQQFTQHRQAFDRDEIWVLEHYPVYTLGLAGKREHLLKLTDIPVLQSDRGGQVTYHGPGQLIIYTLLDVQRLQLTIRQLVTHLEQAIIHSLASYDIIATAKPEAPGVYVNGKKIGSIGLRIKNHCCYHGISLNNQMDLRPFSHINPCGYSGLEMTQLADLGVIIPLHALAAAVVSAITTALYP